MNCLLFVSITNIRTPEVAILAKLVVRIREGARYENLLYPQANLSTATSYQTLVRSCLYLRGR